MEDQKDDVATTTLPAKLAQLAPWATFGFKDEDILDHFKKLKLADVTTLLYLENGMLLTGAFQENKQAKNAKWLRIRYPLQLQVIESKQGPQLVFTPILGLGDQYIAINAQTGITMRSQLNGQQIAAWYHRALFTFGITDDTFKRIQDEQRDKEREAAAQDMDKKLPGLMSALASADGSDDSAFIVETQAPEETPAPEETNDDKVPKMPTDILEEVDEKDVLALDDVKSFVRASDDE